MISRSFVCIQDSFARFFQHMTDNYPGLLKHDLETKVGPCDLDLVGEPCRSGGGWTTKHLGGPLKTDQDPALSKIVKDPLASYQQVMTQEISNQTSSILFTLDLEWIWLQVLWCGFANWVYSTMDSHGNLLMTS